MLTATPLRLVPPSRLTEVSEVVMILMNTVVIISPASIHTIPSSLPRIVLGALSPYLQQTGTKKFCFYSTFRKFKVSPKVLEL